MLSPLPDPTVVKVLFAQLKVATVLTFGANKILPLLPKQVGLVGVSVKSTTAADPTVPEPDAVQPFDNVAITEYVPGTKPVMFAPTPLPVAGVFVHEKPFTVIPVSVTDKAKLPSFPRQEGLVAEALRGISGAGSSVPVPVTVQPFANVTVIV